MLEIHTLGQFELRYDGTLITVPSRAAQSLLSYLAMNSGMSHRREKLAGMLWPDSTEDNARSYLRNALWRLQRSLDEADPVSSEYLHVEDIELRLREKADYWLDAERVLERRDASDWTPEALTEVLSLYQGELLPGFYDEWVVLERERVNAAFDQKMRLLLDGLMREERWEKIIDWAETWISFGRVPEAAFHALMVAHAGLGDLAAVTKDWQRLVHSLEEVLGVEPSDELQRAYQSLSGGNMPTDDTLRKTPAAERVHEKPPAPGEPPYKGLSHFDVADGDLFFGREQLTGRLVDRLREQPSIAVVVGPSGSGKSSIVRAGLIPALKRGEPLAGGNLLPEGSPEWAIRVLTPTARPVEALATSLGRHSSSLAETASLMDDLTRDPRCLHLAVSRVLQENQARRMVIVVDQFEEIFTECQDEAERRAFIDNLMMAAQPSPRGSTAIVIALRADFYAHCADYPTLRQALTRHQEYVGPMTTRELRMAIEKPARQAGWELEEGLVSLMLRDVKREPGGLPLLSHALLETWRRRSGRQLTLKGYAQAGGVHRAITRTAESVYNRLLSEEQQTIARRVFLRLTDLGEGTADTRRRAFAREFSSDSSQSTEVQSVLEILADARLITLGEDSIEVAHEALIREWPRLRRWLDEDREGLLLHRHLTRSAFEWERLDRDSGELYRGVRLSNALAWAEEYDAQLSPLEAEFLEASRKRAEAAEAERARSHRRLRRLVVALSALLLIALAATGFAFQQFSKAQAQARTATARNLAKAAVDNLDTDPERSLLLALYAVQETRGPDGLVLREAEEALHRSLLAMRVQYSVPSDGVLALSPNGDQMLTSSDAKDISMRTASTGDLVYEERAHDARVSTAAFHPDGSQFATGSAEGALILWRSSDGSQLLKLPGHELQIFDLAYSPSGELLASASHDRTVKVWDPATGQEVTAFAERESSVRALAFTPDGARLATASIDSTIKIWDIDSGSEHLTLNGHTGRISDIDFSPDGRSLASAGGDGSLRIWNTETGQEVRSLELDHRAAVTALAYGPDGEWLASGGADTLVRVWDPSTGEQVMTLPGHEDDVAALAFDPEGMRLLSLGKDGTVRVWDVGPDGEREHLTLTGHDSAVTQVAYSPNGDRLVSTGRDGRAILWDAATGERFWTLMGDATQITVVAFSPDGSWLATSHVDGKVRVHNVAPAESMIAMEVAGASFRDVSVSHNGQAIAAVGGPVSVLWDMKTGEERFIDRAPKESASAIDFSPTSPTFIFTRQGGNVILGDLASVSYINSIGAHGAPVHSVAFGPGGTMAVTAGEDGAAKVWPVEVDAAPGEPFAYYGNALSLSGHAAAIWDAEFRPDGRQIATISLDGTIRLWSADPATNFSRFPPKGAM